MAPDLLCRRSPRLRQDQTQLHSTTSKEHTPDNSSSSSDNIPSTSNSASRKRKSLAKASDDDEVAAAHPSKAIHDGDEAEETSKPNNKNTAATAKRKGRPKKALTAPSNSTGGETITNDESAVTAKNSASKESDDGDRNPTNCLARRREIQVKTTSTTHLAVMGIDEAGRGPLAGPVVAAAIVLPSNVDGVVDSKAIGVEAMREDVYQRIIQAVEDDNHIHDGIAATTRLPASARWAVAIVDAATIDEINILQATMKAMAMAAHALMGVDDASITYAESATAQQPGCYVVRSSSVDSGNRNIGNDKANDDNENTITPTRSDSFYALVDGNRIPTNLMCQAEAIVKGDAKEFCIAAASILAKVTRDRLMNEYHDMYPQYNFAQHKGYPTKAHRQVLSQHGPCPIHRRTFAPLKQQLLLLHQQEERTAPRGNDKKR